MYNNQQQQPYQSNISYYQAQQRQMPQMNYQTPLLKGRLVSSFEEAKAMSIDFDGSVFYFPDLANRRIYTKQINLDGTATLNLYELREMPTEAPVVMENNLYITREEFEQAINQLRADLTATPKITF